MLKFLNDKRNRRAQQFPQNRNQPHGNGYRPNAGSGETPLLGGTEKEWERERRPAAIVRQTHHQGPDIDSTQNSEVSYLTKFRLFLEWKNYVFA